MIIGNLLLTHTNRLLSMISIGSDSCKWLLTEGRYKGDKEWQPYGCMMHHYTQT